MWPCGLVPCSYAAILKLVSAALVTVRPLRSVPKGVLRALINTVAIRCGMPASAEPAPADPRVSAGDEVSLVAGLRSADPSAYELFLRLHGGRMLATARRIMGEEEAARDAVQDAMLSIVRSISRFDGASLLSTWAHRIVVNACLMRLRTRRRRPELSIESLLPRFDDRGHRELSGPGSTPSALARHDSPADGIEQRELRRTVWEAIARLPDGYREVLIMRDMEQLDTQQTAAALGLTVDAAKTRLHRARQALRAILEKDPAACEAVKDRRAGA
jgi:RNA polymerase sigma-70 factor, ECF subfamily